LKSQETGSLIVAWHAGSIRAPSVVGRARRYECTLNTYTSIARTVYGNIGLGDSVE